MPRVLITGGAGFIGSHLADELLLRGYAVRALDALVEQVHGPGGTRPDYLDPEVELLVGDARDPDAVRKALVDVDAVVHLAARVGVGQSMYEVAAYTEANSTGTAVLLEALLDRPVGKVVVASSMSIYGEGLYLAGDGTPVAARRLAAGAGGSWDPVDELGRPLRPAPTPESKQPALESIYALTKYDQERLCLIFGDAYDIPTVALRFFNTYGPRQALSNPYTGVLAIFAARLMNGRPPLVYEDGLQRRDFVSVADVARACRLALESEAAAAHAINVGTGRGVTVLEVARALAAILGLEIAPQVTREYRTGDVRHCYADVELARALFDFSAEVELEQGMTDLAAWLESQAPEDRLEKAARELASRGLTR